MESDLQKAKKSVKNSFELVDKAISNAESLVSRIKTELLNDYASCRVKDCGIERKCNKCQARIKLIKEAEQFLEENKY